MGGHLIPKDERDNDRLRNHYSKQIADRDSQIEKLTKQTVDQRQRIDDLAQKLTACEISREQYLKRKLKERRAEFNKAMQSVRVAQRHLAKALLQGEKPCYHERIPAN